MSKRVIFSANEVIEIIGAETDTECSHCGRVLKVGIRLAGFSGCFGAACLASALAPYTYGGKKFRHGADSIKERGIVARKGAECMKRHNMGPHHFRFALQSDLHSI